MAAEGITGHLYTSTPGVTITEPEVEFGSIPPADSAWSLTGFGVRLAPGLPDDYPVACSLVCTGAGDTWVSLFVLPTRNAVFRYVGCRIEDAGGIRPNGRLDPGESAELVVTIANTGSGNRFEVGGALRSLDTIIAVTDSSGFFGTVLAGDSAACADRFEVTAEPGMTPGISIPCELRVSGDHGFDTMLVFALATGEMVGSDPIPDGPRTPPVYFAYDDGDVFYEQAPDYEWVEIRGVGTRLELLDQETKPLALPAGFGPFVYYDAAFDTISVCSNGWFAPGASTDRAWQNRELPTTRHRALVAVLWDDLNPELGGGVYWWHDPANHRLVVEWDSVRYSWQPTAWDRFQVIIHDTTMAGPDGNSSLTCQYATASSIVAATVGMQDAEGLVGINCLFDNRPHAGSLPFAAGRAIRFTTEPPVLIGVAEPAGAAVLPGNGRLAVTPNPAPGRVLVRFGLAHTGAVVVRVFDASGRAARTLADGRFEAGEHAVAWDGLDDSGRQLARGVYFVRLVGGGAREEAKFIRARR
ncbi:T9SS type A sorting domain-containing protein [candidate division WOR-3 bacterium]|nr:T9SS type A sorting domain-containing protein [candidate division WOR-3 bacterium]